MEVRLMARYEPIQKPTLQKSAREYHDEVDSLTSDGFDGVVSKRGALEAVTGDLTNSDISEIEDYAGVHFDEVEQL